MKIYIASEADWQAWLELRYCLWPYHTKAELESEMREIFGRLDKDVLVLLAREEGAAIGFAEVSLQAAALGCNTSPVGYLEGWYVEAVRRNEGIGRLLIEAGEAWAIEKGCKEMASDTCERYPVSPAAHRALGYEEVELALHYRKSIMKT